MKGLFCRMFCIIVFAPIGLIAVIYSCAKSLLFNYTGRGDIIEKFAIWYADKIEE